MSLAELFYVKQQFRRAVRWQRGRRMRSVAARPRRHVLEPLEPRMLLSADPVVVIEPEVDSASTISPSDVSVGTQTDIQVGPAPSALVVANFGGDSLNDIAVANSGDDTVTLLTNVGAGVFNPTTFDVGAASSALATADLDGDQRDRFDRRQCRVAQPFHHQEEWEPRGEVPWKRT